MNFIFETRNYEHYDALLKRQQKILDVGCGFGYMSYFLHYKDESREILGLDYDEDKISIAANGFDKTANLNFRHIDINSYKFEQFDAILLNDVLHYFSEEKQLWNHFQAHLEPRSGLQVALSKAVQRQKERANITRSSYAKKSKSKYRRPFKLSQHMKWQKKWHK